MLLEEHIYQFLKELQRFDYTLSGIDHVWKILFKNYLKALWKLIHFLMLIIKKIKTDNKKIINTKHRCW